MRRASILLQAFLYTGAGVLHLWFPAPYLRIMPPWLPAHSALVALSGIAEIILGILLVPVTTRRLAGWGIVALLLAVFPANIQMAINWHRQGHPQEWMAWLRLPLQAMLIWWALRSTSTRAQKQTDANPG